MAIDPKGTTPGLPTGAQKETGEVNMSCRSRRCDNMTAAVIQIPGQDRMRMYRCTNCSHTWGINLGGSVNL